MVWNLVSSRFKSKSCIFLNTRNDRRYRTIQLVDLVLKDIKPDLFIIRADNVSSILNSYEFDKKNIVIFNMDTEPGLVVQKILDLNNYFILGIGNIVDWGEQFINRLKEHV